MKIMAFKFEQHVPHKKIVGDQPVDRPIAGRTDMVENNTSGFIFETPLLKQVERFLILGTTGGTYYVKEKKLTKDNVSDLDKALFKHPIETIDLIVNISTEGRCLKNETCIFALAYAGSVDNKETRKYALSKLNEVCRIGTHLFAFVEYSKYFRGRGRLFSDALKNWYLDLDVSKLAYQLVKYQSRNGWSHRDVLRLCKPKTDNKDINTLFAWAVKKPFQLNCANKELRILVGHELAFQYDHLTTISEKKEAIDCYGLTREMIPTDWLKIPEIWASLIKNSPYDAMMRNLGVLTANGYIKPLSDNVDYIIGRITNEEELKRSRQHPIQILMAYHIYKSGRGLKGNLIWNPENRIVTALEKAFYMAFENIKPTNKKYLLCIDVSASMSWNNIGGIPGFTPRVASAVLAMTTIKAEPKCYILGFHNVIQPLAINETMSLKEVTDVLNNTSFGSTNIGLMFEYAIDNKLDVDVFVCYTDNEVNQGSHPSTLLKKYRTIMNKPNAKLIVTAMESNGFTIADPLDSNMLDVVGFDSNTPAVISSFSLL
jgi:60 kDa SS-A/Ro ribonucleoprotein